MAYSTFPSANNSIYQPAPPTIKAKKRPSSGSSGMTRIHSSNLGPYDVICGRCVNAYNNVGNRRFRVTIRMNFTKYQANPSRQGRSLLFVSLVHFLKNEVGVRFFKPIRDKQRNQQGKWYIEMTEKEARDKVGHAFRDMARTTKTQNKSTVAAEQRVDATLSQMVNHKLLPSPIPPSNNKTLDSMSKKCPPPPARRTTVLWGRTLTTCDDFLLES